MVRAALLGLTMAVASHGTCRFNNASTNTTPAANEQPNSELSTSIPALPVTSDDGGAAPRTDAEATPAQIAADLPTAPAPLAVGATAPPFRLSTTRETFDSAQALRRGPLVLIFYIGDFCIYCRQQLQQVQARLGEFESAGASVWAISADTVSTSTALAHTLGLAFPLPSDPDLNVIRAFGVQAAGTQVALPSVFVLRAEGGRARVIYQHVGANQADRAGVDTVLAAVRSAH